MPGPGRGLELGLKLGRLLNSHFDKQRTLRKIEEVARGEQERLRAELSAPLPIHGSARWAATSDLSAAGLLHPATSFDNPSALLLGAFPSSLANGADGWLYWDGEGHLLTVAPTRSGKSTTLIIPNLLRYRGSVVVLDPKGELFQATSRWRAANVGPVYRIAPFDRGTGLPRDGFNPLRTVDSQSDARVLADLMIPSDAKAQDFFKKDAVAFLSALILFVLEVEPPELQTLTHVRAITTASTEVFLDIAEAMLGSKIPAVVNAANIVLGKSQDRGLASLRDTLNSDLSIWDDPGVMAATASSEVDFKALKDQPATVYVTVPFDKIEAFAPFIKVLLTCALEAMIQNPREPKIPTLFLLDEFLALGPFQKFLNAINTHASAGVRLWFFLQNLARLEEHYPTAWKNFFDATVKIFFGVRDPFTAKLISEFLGDRTVAYRSSSISVGLSSSSSNQGMDHSSGLSGNLTSSVNYVGRSLLTPSEVVGTLEPAFPDKSRQAVLFVPNTPPVLGRLIPYFIGQRCLERQGAYVRD